eukprot:GCRY01001382.1.p1 GENE.GCRY01001382.1~~GCRY01001382.1.p1  ORF type:complete len:192 (+),score=5.94 GCRY01001382.1:144-719(+)
MVTHSYFFDSFETNRGIKMNVEDSLVGEKESITPQICPSQDLFPYCVVWTPIPLLTWLLPFIGHVGVCSSKGLIHDYAGSFTVSVNNMAFGKPTRYFKLKQKNIRTKVEYDSALSETATEFEQRTYNFFSNNCHDFVCVILNRLYYSGRRWGIFLLGATLFFCGSFVSFGRFVQTVLPSILLWGLLLFLII